MLSSEIVTSIQEGYKLNIVLLDNHGYASIGGLSNAVGSGGFGTRYQYRTKEGKIAGDDLPIDFVANAASLGAHSLRVKNLGELQEALKEAKQATKTTVIVVETDIEERVPGYEAWWDVAVAAVSSQTNVQKARKKSEQAVKKERYF
jgi:3D-(3,5/4)-trihydroxycyclohexane-1,2-dione acylhydrolase (decyclizing)